MFDGSHRTNRREINLAGASASSRSSRKSNLNVARQQRLARAQAKAKLNGAKCLQRSWRGSRGRRAVASELDEQFQAMVGDLSHYVDSPTAPSEQQKISRAASLLAFRVSPALLPFFASHRNEAGGAAADGKKKWGAGDGVAESCMRKDLLSLCDVLCPYILCPFGNTPTISPIAARRITSITIILLRQSIQFMSLDRSNNDVGIKHVENQRLVQLVDVLLEASFSTNVSAVAVLTRERSLWTKRPSDYFMDVLRNKPVASSASGAGWMINIFLCFRDISAYHNSRAMDGRGVASMDIDDIPTDSDDQNEMKILLKWCCQVIVQLATLDGTQQQQQTQPRVFQQGLALLSSAIFVSSTSSEPPSWLNEQLSSCMVRLEQQVGGKSGSDGTASPTSWRPIMIHFLATSLNALSSSPVAGSKMISAGGRVDGLLEDYAPFTSDAASEQNPWLEGIRDTMASREFLVMNAVLSYAKTCQNETQQLKELLTLAIPTILQYTLKHQPDLAILASYSAQGDDIMALVIDESANDGRNGSTSTNLANAAAAAAFGEDNVEETEDDDDEMHVSAQNPQPDPTHKSTTTSSGRHSRADLQTLPKLDALYQTSALRAKKATIDRLRSLRRSHGKQVTMLVSLAEKIGKGEWIQQLGNTLFSSAASSAPPVILQLLAPMTLSSWKKQAQMSYTSALSTVMATCSGIKAGRNAASPLLAKLAFHDLFLRGLGERSLRNTALITSQSSQTNTTAVASACEVFSSFCDVFSHNLLAVDDDDFLERYHDPQENGKLSSSEPNRFVAKEVVLALKIILNDLYWSRPVLAADISADRNDPESNLRFQRARLLLSGTKLWNSLYERWCRLYRVTQFCGEDCWWFPHLASSGRHDNNPIMRSQETTLQDDAMDDSSVESAGMDDTEEAAPMSAEDASGDALASTFRDPKIARVLTYIPQAMPFSRRVNLFNSLLESDKLRTQDETLNMRQFINAMEEGEEPEIAGRERVTIRRDALYSDSKQRLNKLGKKLRKRVQITFVNRHGQQEAGIDGGGVFKEFLDDLISDAFLPQTIKEESGDAGDDDSVMEIHPDFFSVTPLQTLKVNTSTDGNHSILSHYEFLGRVLGKAIYESILVEPQFCLPFLNKLLGKQNQLDDLKNLDPIYYKNLKSLRHMNANEIQSLGLTFELHDSATATIELMPGGSNIPVTKENVIQYIHLVSHQKMNVQGSRQTAAFLHGFRDIVPAQWVRLFSAYELQKLISGDDAVKGIDVQGFMNVMRYSGGLHPSQPIVQWLWHVVGEMSPEQQRKFLKFMTSCSRQPLLGFGSMVPHPCIQQIRLREDDAGNDVAEGLATGSVRLPSSSTCMNLLKLPKYTSYEMLKEKLLYAIESASGFELS